MTSEGLVEITNEAMVPDDLCTVTVTIPWKVWKTVIERTSLLKNCAFKEITSRVPSLSLIAEALQEPCLKCDGEGRIGDARFTVSCPECGGTGRASVPGARLRQRATPQAETDSEVGLWEKMGLRPIS